MSFNCLVHLGFLYLNSLWSPAMKYRKSFWSITDHLVMRILLILAINACRDSRSGEDERAQIWMKSSVHLLSIC